MAGGLVQLIVYGSQDIFLTGTPQITFFKILYRRHTNFAIESVPQHLLGDLNFGNDSSAIIDKIGDLMGKTYLEIEIPKIDLLKNPSQWSLTQQDAERQFKQIEEYYRLLHAYVSVNTDIARKIILLIRTNNITINDITNIITNPNFIDNLINIRQQLQSYIAINSNFDNLINYFSSRSDLVQQINRTDVSKIFSSVIRSTQNISNETEIRKKLLSAINTAYNELKEFYLQIYKIFLEKENIYQSFLNKTYHERYKSAWVEELGHAIIDQLDIRIGNQLIDRHTGDWLIIFNSLYLRSSQNNNYNKMIGNVNELTIFDDNVKNSYKIIIPFQFWFCRFTGLAIPLISLKYHDVMFNIRLKDLSKLFYVEDNLALSNITILQSQYGINIESARLYVDYIFLDTDERRRFAQSTHEYLIEIVQFNEFEDIAGNKYAAHLLFAHPTKFVVWFVQPNQYRSNPTGSNKPQWNNFGTEPNKSGQTIESLVLRINSYDRTDAHIGIKYYNNVQPYWYFRKTPSDGLYTYSFAIKPMEHQPSAAINLSRIDDFSIYTNFTQRFVNIINSNNIEGINTGAYMGVYAMSYNILRIMGGMAGLAFQNSS